MMSNLLERFGFRYCPRCAVEMVERTVHGQTRRVCPLESCGFIQFIEPKVAVNAMVVHKGRFLLIKRGMNPGLGKWCFPGGFMDADETPQQTATRECLEETGLEVVVRKLVDVFAIETSHRNGILITYQADLSGGGVARAGDDADEVGFFSPDELPELAFDTNEQAIQRWVNGEL